MTEREQVQQQHVEIDYINSLLGVDSQQRTENETVEITKNSQALHNTDIKDDSLYQLLLVDGLKLAIPLSEITQAVDYNNAVIKGDMLLHHGEQLTIINLSALIWPQKKVLEAGSDSKQYLLIQHRQLAIECQQILEMKTIEKHLVCWRNENSQRKWLAGTVKQQNIAILDLTMLQQTHNNE